MQNLTFQEKEAFHEIRRRFKNDISPEKFEDENMFYRFLKARDFDVDLAEAMLRKDIAWRKAAQVDTILLDYKPTEVAKKYVPDSFLGFDKDGCAIQYCELGAIDDEGLFKCIKLTEFYRYLIYIVEVVSWRIRKQNEALGKNVFQCLMIYDLKDLTFVKATHKRNVQNLMFLINLFQDHYPETLKKLFIINAPVYFTMVYSVLKPFLADAVQKKIQPFGHDGWKEALLEIVDADVLPAFLGGRRTDPDGNPLCNSFVNHAAIVPKSYYMCNCKIPMYERADATRLTILPMSKDQIEINVEEYDYLLEWEYETKQGDIGFGLFHQENYNGTLKNEELIPVHRVHSSNGSEAGTFRCEKLGIYILLFDNSYSYFHQKELYYKTNLRKVLKDKTFILE